MQKYNLSSGIFIFYSTLGAIYFSEGREYSAWRTTVSRMIKRFVFNKLIKSRFNSVLYNYQVG